MALTMRYPVALHQRDQWILARRGARNQLDPFKPHAFFVEKERAESGELISVATIFLTNRECPWRCLMCDLWKNTLTETVPAGAILKQIDYALSRTDGFGFLSRSDSRPAKRVRRSGGDVPPIKQIKLYNSGSFFDPRAIPPDEHEGIACRVAGFERVIVECHPALVGKSAIRFQELLRAAGDDRQAAPARLEVAMGLETAHPEVLKKLNKRMTIEHFRRAANFLKKNDIALRVFVLVKPPFLSEEEALDWVNRSVDFAFDCGATAVSLIPTRFGNGALEVLAQQGGFSPPELATLEAALDHGVGLKRGRVFADVWDLEKFSGCGECFERRRARLQEMNLGQTLLPRVVCACCENKGRGNRTSSGAE